MTRINREVSHFSFHACNWATSLMKRSHSEETREETSAMMLYLVQLSCGGVIEVLAKLLTWGKRGSNPRPLGLESSALPLSYSPALTWKKVILIKSSDLRSLLLNSATWGSSCGEYYSVLWLSLNHVSMLSIQFSNPDFNLCPYSSVVEHSLRKRKVGGSIPPGGCFWLLLQYWSIFDWRVLYSLFLNYAYYHQYEIIVRSLRHALVASDNTMLYFRWGWLHFYVDVILTTHARWCMYIVPRTVTMRIVKFSKYQHPPQNIHLARVIYCAIRSSLLSFAAFVQGYHAIRVYKTNKFACIKCACKGVNSL